MIESYTYKIIKQEGFNEGFGKGFGEGIDEGAMKMAKEDIIGVLATRFGTVPFDISEKIGEINDLSFLKNLQRKYIYLMYYIGFYYASRSCYCCNLNKDE